MASSPLIVEYDVVVVGSGNAGFSSAIAAAQAGAGRVLLIDKCPEDWAGGNSYFTAGAFRTVHAGLEDLLPIVNNVDSGTAKTIDLDPYTRDHFMSDLLRVTLGRSDPELGRVLVDQSNDAIKWLSGIGVRFQLSFNRQAYKVNDRYKFWGGLCLKTEDGGKGLVEDHKRAARRHGVTVWYSTAAYKLNMDPNTGAFVSILANRRGDSIVIKAKAVILAAGGFESNPRMRSSYLGPGWDLAHVRGTPYNTGECLEMVIRDASARPMGQWSGCHSVAWDANTNPHSGDREISNEFTKSGYPLGVTINTLGKRFADEGSDLRNYTYAKFGKAILAQPQGLAFQVWDSTGTSWLRDEEYRDERVQKIHASSIEGLARKCSDHGLEDPAKFEETIREYNAAVHAHQKENPRLKWNPAEKDRISTQSSSRRLEIPKSNWALPIEKGPFMAVKVGCGVTFTFGGVAVDPQTSAVISNLTGKPVPGLFCAGEMVGGLFYNNYPGGSGLTSGTIFGRNAGIAAAAQARKNAASLSARL